MQIELGVISSTYLRLDDYLSIETSCGQPCDTPIVKADDVNEYLLKQARLRGLKRPHSTSLSVLQGCAIHDYLPLRYLAGDVVIAFCSSSSPASISFKFERQGQVDGWNLVDPFLLQNTLPSFAASTLLSAYGLSGKALGFPGGLLGIISALQHVTLLLESGQVDFAIIILAEELFPTYHSEFDAWSGLYALAVTSATSTNNLYSKRMRIKSPAKPFHSSSIVIAPSHAHIPLASVHSAVLNGSGFHAVYALQLIDYHIDISLV